MQYFKDLKTFFMKDKLLKKFNTVLKIYLLFVKLDLKIILGLFLNLI
jgi:hypothetical protein